jgi:hypothetical protein
MNNCCGLVCFVALVSLWAQGCAVLDARQIERASVNAAVNSAGQAAAEARQEPPFGGNRLVKPGGWEIPWLAQSVPKFRGVVSINGKQYAPLHWTRRDLPGEDEDLIEIDYFTDEERKKLGLLRGEYGVMEIVEFDAGGRPFRYALSIHPVQIGAICELHFSDEDGDGAFETVERRRSDPVFVPDIPTWARPGQD